MPKMSIIVTAYNIDAYIRQSLDCVLAQTLQDIEIIVVDDGSTDGTADIIREYAQKDARIKPILFETNTIGGVATAANAGMDAATGDFIGFADGDDIYDPQMFGRLYDAAVAHSADLAMCGYQLLDVSTGQLSDPADIDRWRAYPQETALELDDTTRRAMLRFVSVPWRKIYRRDLVERINLRFPVGDYFFEDNPFHWASILGGQRIVLIPEKLCQHRVARVGQTMATVDSKLLKIFKHHDNIRDWLRHNDQEDNYGKDLLAWTANQLSWVSQRAEGPLIRELYDALRPVIDQYDQDAIEDFGGRNGRGRTFLMLKALRANDFADFTRIVNAQSQRGGQNAGPHRPGTLVSRGLYHLKYSGVRETMRMVGRYLSARTGIGPIRVGRREVQDKHRVTNEDLIAALSILQRDIRNLRAEVRAARQDSPRREGDQ
ncbi:Glycosyl transferase family 2 [Paracoccus alcaliphilus]|uniref:Glycosyl transferase family 2 n=1 Tax=Paracoccus alcaliphilus TaxID=34002 RepID=A0A1H8HHL2_9RHOB|nr:glycosyltransferase [Paracoccus alcaliphilus]WCR20722.1 glycosyltransferase [Paracoccus alcaliphilus]SEN55630.1 Glycosyl transferase family 2 [Paracoccus alcaliphilus]